MNKYCTSFEVFQKCSKEIYHYIINTSNYFVNLLVVIVLNVEQAAFLLFDYSREWEVLANSHGTVFGYIHVYAVKVINYPT